MDKFINEIICGSALAVLKTMPAESVNCIITSPPYWNLRAYGTEPQIWDGDTNCVHNWQDDIIKKQSGGTEKTNVGNFKDNRIHYNMKSNFCSLCGAWRGELGLEPDFSLYIKHLVQIFNEAKRVLRKDGTLFVDIGDTYGTVSGTMGQDKYKQPKYEVANEAMKIKQPNINMHKCLIGIPERFMLAMIDAGWILRNKIIWHKKNCMPCSAKDRFTVDFEPVFFFVKSKKYWFDMPFEPYAENSDMAYRKTLRLGKNYKVKTPYAKNTPLTKSSSYNNPAEINTEGRHCRCVWTINTKPFPESHFAVFPEALVEPMIKAGCPKDGIVLDPFAGSCTVLRVAAKLGRNYCGIELKPEYIKDIGEVYLQAAETGIPVQEARKGQIPLFK